MLLDLVFSYFCREYNAMYCELEFYTIVVHEVFYSHVFFLKKLKLWNLKFCEVQKTCSTEPSVPKRRSRATPGTYPTMNGCKFNASSRSTITIIRIGGTDLDTLVIRRMSSAYVHSYI
jgi:hypothetical protein